MRLDQIHHSYSRVDERLKGFKRRPSEQIAEQMAFTPFVFEDVSRLVDNKCKIKPTADPHAKCWSNDYLDRERDIRSLRTDKPIVTRQISANLVGTCAVVALGVCVPLSMISGWRAGTIHLIAVALAWLYNIKLKSTLTVAGVIGICGAVLSGRQRAAWPLTLCLAGISVIALIVNGNSIVIVQ